MDAYIGIMDMTIVFPDNIKNNKEECNELLDKIMDQFINTIEDNNCLLYSISDVVIDNKEA